jgi:hypothetical protein
MERLALTLLFLCMLGVPLFLASLMLQNYTKKEILSAKIVCGFNNKEELKCYDLVERKIK